jgi:predicted nucleic acid-binding protein
VKALFDTSTLIAALVASHSAHAAAVRRLQHIKSGADVGFISAHSLAELYATLTTIPSRPRIPPAIAWQSIHRNILTLFQIVSLTDVDYAALIEQLS